jgi:hypothetical protein
MSSNRKPNRAWNLWVLQVNVRRSWPVHKCALETAFQSKADIILIQEPATFTLHHRTQAHEAYRTLVPQDTWPTRPRVMTYIREDSGLKAIQLSSGLSSDLLKVTVSGQRFPLLHIWNVYNSPAGSAGAGEAVNLLIQYRFTLIPLLPETSTSGTRPGTTLPSTIPRTVPASSSGLPTRTSNSSIHRESQPTTEGEYWT